jgi:hypothetical protein
MSVTGPRTSMTALQNLQSKLGSIRVLIIDEFSFLYLKHLHNMDIQARRGRPFNFAQFMGGIFCLFAGDFYQHSPIGPSGKSLYTNAGKESEEQHPATRSWRDISYVFFFNRIHGFVGNVGGQKLLKLSKLFIQKIDDKQVCSVAVKTILQDLDSKYIGPYTNFVDNGADVRVIVQRNTLCKTIH